MIKAIFIISLIFSALRVSCQQGNYAIIAENGPIDSIITKAARIVPSQRQYGWQRLEMTAFLHFTMNTFTDREWGEGTEPPTLFNPANLDAGQWVKVCKDAGFKLIIITAKHHDGFCLWPSKYTEHSVKNSPWKNGKGDVVREVADACKAENIKFGFYLSPWDRHEKSYGDSPKYNDHFINQLRELLTNYGKIWEVWFDGACGEGPNGKKQVYDWESYYKIIRELQPDACIAVMGPDVRWIGTESGYGRDTEWSVLPADAQNHEKIAANSQQEKAESGFIPSGDMMAEDLGSREKIKNAKMLIWYPSEVDVSIRPGWFWHESENNRVKTPEKLFDIYLNSVGKNSLLLLNIPPDNQGLITDYDIASLKGFKRLINNTFANNLAKGALVNITGNYKKGTEKYLTDNKYETCWIPENNTYPIELIFDLKKETCFDKVMLQENINIGQRIEKFSIYYWKDNEWKLLQSATTVGYKRILYFKPVVSSKIKLVIEQSRLKPAISHFGIFKSPPFITISPQTGVFTDSLEVSINSSDKDALIYYTMDGTEPSVKSFKYKHPFYVNKQCMVKAFAVSKDGISGIVNTSEYIKAKNGIKLETTFSPNYQAGGVLGLIDGKKGSLDFGCGFWQGYEGVDLDASVDLNEIKSIQNISVNFLSDTKSWIFFPDYVEISISEDGKTFTKIGEKNYKELQKPDEKSIQTFTLLNLQNTKARYVRVFAKNTGICPEWHDGASSKAWLFVDEITVE